MRLRRVENYACYYGTSALEKLAGYDLVILQAENYSAEELAWLAQQQVTVVAYASLGEQAVTQREPPWLLRDPVTGDPLRNATWNTWLVDCRSLAWQSHLVENVIPDLLTRGVGGLFLDTIDVQEAYPVTRDGVIHLLHEIRHAFPVHILVNRGFAIAEALRGVADGIVFESFTTTHDGTHYREWRGPDLAWTAQMAVRLTDVCAGLPILALDYAGPTDAGLRQRARRRAEAYGFASFTTTYALDWLP